MKYPLAHPGRHHAPGPIVQHLHGHRNATQFALCQICDCVLVKSTRNQKTGARWQYQIRNEVYRSQVVDQLQTMADFAAFQAAPEAEPDTSSEVEGIVRSIAEHLLAGLDRHRCDHEPELARLRKVEEDFLAWRDLMPTVQS